MGKGYAEGPAADEAERRREEKEDGSLLQVAQESRQAVFGATPADPVPHFLGWREDVDPDALFAGGEAWGLTVRRVVER
ncbi:MAG: hypothetical protein ACKVUT_12830 [Gaiella sp.]